MKGQLPESSFVTVDHDATDELAEALGRALSDAMTLGPVAGKARADELEQIGRRLVERAAVVRREHMQRARWAWGAQGAAERLGVSAGYVRRITPGYRAPRTAAGKRDAVLDLYGQGLPMYRVAWALHMSQRDVVKALDRAGVVRRETHRRRDAA
jgi:hypothetical protein